MGVSERRERRLRVAIALNAAIVAFQVGLGLVAHSLGLLADAGHNLADVAAMFASLIAVRVARRPATESHSFGYHRSTILAALANAATIVAVSVVVTVEAIRRLTDPQPVRGGLVVVGATLAFVANFAAAAVIRGRSGASRAVRAAPAATDAAATDRHAHDHDHLFAGAATAESEDLNMRSAWLHSIGDAAASLAVVLAGIVILASGGWYWLDPTASLVVSGLIGFEGYQLLRAAADVLLESTPAGLDIAQLEETMSAVSGVEAVHDLHVWTLSSDVRALSAHVVMEGHPTLEEAQVVGDRVKSTIAGPFRIAHATLELECEACDAPPDCLSPSELS